MTHGILYPNVHDEQQLLDKDFFEQVPERLFAEIKDFYKTYEISAQSISFDRTPQKWGWLICLESNNKLNSKHVFIGTSGWYESRSQPGFEG